MNLTPKQVYARSYYAKNREKLLTQRKAYYESHPEEIRSYSRSYHQKNSEKRSAYYKIWKQQNPLWHNAYERNYKPRRIQMRNELHSELVQAYGGQCICCKESNEGFLTLEHIGRDGGKHLERLGSSWQIWRELKRLGWPKDNYTILCMNCNWAIRFGGICPHKKA